MSDEERRETTSDRAVPPAPMSNVSQLIGMQVRAIRERAGVPQAQIASDARLLGLPWARTSVTTLEAGRRALSIEELVLLPRVLSQSCGSVTLADLVPLGAEVRLSKSVHANGEAVRATLAAQPSTLDTLDASSFEPPQVVARTRESRAQKDASYRDQRARWPDFPETQRLIALLGAGEEADLKAAVSIGVSVQLIAVAARVLWGRSLTEERNARASQQEREQDRSNPKVLGHISRALIVELRHELDAAETRRAAHVTKGHPFKAESSDPDQNQNDDERKD